MAKEYFEEWYPSAMRAHINFGDDLKRGWNKDAAFMLHQATERLYHCVLLVLTFYTPHVHNLAFLRAQAERLDRRIHGIWPTDNRRERGMFEKLKVAYVKARYSKHYRITEEELSWLGTQVEELAPLRDFPMIATANRRQVQPRPCDDRFHAWGAAGTVGQQLSVEIANAVWGVAMIRLLIPAILGLALVPGDVCAQSITTPTVRPRILTDAQFRCLVQHNRTMRASGRDGTLFDLSDCPKQPSGLRNAYPLTADERYIRLTQSDIDCLGNNKKTARPMAQFLPNGKVAVYLNPCGK